MLIENPGLLKPMCKTWKQSNDSVLYQTCIQCIDVIFLTTCLASNRIQSNIKGLVDATLVRNHAAVNSRHTTSVTVQRYHTRPPCYVE